MTGSPFRIAAIALLLCLPAAAQMKMTVGQLKSMLRSSIQLNHPDKQVADYVKNIRLTERLTERDIQELLAEGLGPKTADALKALSATTAALPKPAVDPVKPAAPPPPMPAPSAEEQKKIIEEARELALGYTKRLPDFICLQVTRRYYDPSGLEQYILSDTIANRLSYFEQKEDYKLISVNGRMAETTYDRLGGATSTGEFGTMMREIFMPETEAEFWWERWARLRGKIVHVYGYRVRQSKSKWRVSWQRQLEVVPGYKGLIYIDKDVPMVYRLTLEAENMPASFPIQEAKSMLDYDFSEIADKPFLLPLRAEVRMREGRFLVKNQVEFRNYRKFGAEATITFDVDAAPLPEDKEKPPQEP